MSYLETANSAKFSLIIEGVSETLGLISFTGQTAISSLYYFDLMLVSDNEDLEDLPGLFTSNVSMIFHKAEADKEHEVHGVFSEFEQIKQTQYDGRNYTLYKARMVPKLWWLTLSKRNQVFLEKSVPDIMTEILEDSDLASSDFNMAELGSYEDNDYVCQFNESHFDFISRWMEREGIYYYFDHEAETEQVIFVDTLSSHDEPFDKEIAYKPDRDLSDTTKSRFIQTFTGRQKQLPQMVYLKDYNPERPSLYVEASATVDEMGRGEVYLYGDHFADPEEGSRLAFIRAEQMLSEQKEFFGESTASALAPGYIFTLGRHYRDSYNAKYLVTEVSHEGSQASCIKSDILTGLGLSVEDVPYSNSFKAIPADTQFRPRQSIERPRISGTLNAKIDAEGDGAMAEVDEYGRYKVKLPFTQTDDILDGKASAWLRMIQPHAGENQGMQFPLRKGTDVVVSFIDGHPDRPIIAGAVNNPETPGVVTAENHNVGFIATEDLLATRALGGAHRDVASKGPSFDGVTPYDDFRRNHQTNFSDDDWQFPKLDPIGKGAVTPGGDYNALEGFIANNAAPDNDGIPGEYSGQYLIKREYGDQYCWGDGKVYSWDNQLAFTYGNDYEEIHEIDDPETGEGYKQRLPLTVDESDKDSVLNVNNFDPTGREGHDGYDDIHYPESVYGVAYNSFNDGEPWEDGGNGLTEKNWGDKVEFHMGRSFNFSGGPGPGGSNEAYNYGNGYSEDLLEKTYGNFAQHYGDTRHDRIFAATAPVTINVGIASMSKAAGHSYSYTRGVSYDVVEDLDAYSETYGGTSEDYVYTSMGIPRSKTVEKNDMGMTEETIYDVTSGIPVSFSTESTSGGATASFKTSMGAVAELETRLAATSTTEVNVGAVMNIVANAGAFMDVSSTLGAMVEVGTHVVHIEVDSALGVEMKFPGMKVAQDPLVKLENTITAIQAATCTISSELAAVVANGVEVTTTPIQLNTGMDITV